MLCSCTNPVFVIILFPEIENFLVEDGQKGFWPICSWDAKILVRTPPLFWRMRSKFWLTPPEGREILKIKKEGGSTVEGQAYLKGGGWHFFYLIFSKFIIFTFRNCFTLCKIVLCIWRKIIFSVTIILWKNVTLSCLKINLKISQKLRKPICKGI